MSVSSSIFNLQSPLQAPSILTRYLKKACAYDKTHRYFPSSSSSSSPLRYMFPNGWISMNYPIQAPGADDSRSALLSSLHTYAHAHCRGLIEKKTTTKHHLVQNARSYTAGASMTEGSKQPVTKHEHHLDQTTTPASPFRLN